MPRVALGDNEMVLSSWLVEEGQEFGEGDPLIEIETDKASMEVEAPEPGVLALRLREPGAKVSPGELLAILADHDEEYDKERLRERYLGERVTGSAHSPAPQPIVVPPSAPPPQPASAVHSNVSRPGEGDAPACNSRRVEAPPPALSPGTGSFTGSGALYGLPARRRPAASPGADGSPKNPAATVRDPLSRHRRALAKLMTESSKIPQFSVHRNLPMHEAVRLVSGLRRSGVAATVTDVLLRATAMALVRHPELHGWFTGDAVQRFTAPAISLATDSPSGVVAPVIRGAERLTWTALARERKRVVDGARRGRLLPADMNGGTFSISNVGGLGGDMVIPLLAPPQIAILGVGRVRPEWGKQVAAAALVADHRVLDGGDAARFLATLADILADVEALGGHPAEVPAHG